MQVILEFRPEWQRVGRGKLPGRRSGYYEGPRARVARGRWTRGEQFKRAGEGPVGQGKGVEFYSK